MSIPEDKPLPVPHKLPESPIVEPATQQKSPEKTPESILSVFSHQDSSAAIVHYEATPMNQEQVLQNQNVMQGLVERAQNELLVATDMEPNKLESLVNFIQIKGEKLVDKLIEKLDEKVPAQNPDEPIVQSFMIADPFSIPFFETLELLASETSSSVPVNDILGISEVEEMTLIDEMMLNTTAAAELGVIFINSLGRAGVLIVMATLVEKTKQVIKSKQKAASLASNRDIKENLEHEIALLQNWVDQQTDLIKEQTLRSGLLTFLAAPKIGSSILHLMGQGATPTGAAFGWMIIGVSLISSALEWRKASKEIEMHRSWTENLASPTDASKVLSKQEDIALAQVDKKLRPILDEIDKYTLLPDSSAYLDAVKERLKESGFLVEPLDRAQSLAELKELLSKEDIKLKIAETPGMKHKEALSVSSRQALKTLLARKDATDRGFLKLKLHRARAMFTLTGLVAALTITLKVLAIVGVVSIAGIFVASGYGILAIGVVLLLVGLAYFYYKKPNLFKTYAKGVQVRLGFKTFLNAVQKFRRQNAILEASRTASSARVFAGRLLQVEALFKEKGPLQLDKLPKELIRKLTPVEQREKEISEERRKELLLAYQKLIEKNERQVAEISRKATALNESVNRLEGDIKKLQDKITDAGWKDYLALLKYKGARKLEKSGDSQTTETESEASDPAVILAQALLEDSSLLDDTETMKVLKHMEIDLPFLRRQPDKKIVEEAVAHNLRTFFAMDDEKTLALIYQLQRQQASQ